jgi:hypothetical protein
MAAGCFLLCAAAPAAADWYFTPFVGWGVGGTTTLLDLEYNQAPRSKFTFGGSVMLLQGIFGVEADYMFMPRFFQNPDPETTMINPDPVAGPTFSDSHVQSITGSFVLAAPLSLTRESLRPYLVAGLGWMDASAQPAVEALREELSVNSDLTAFTLGVGAIGMFGDLTGMRFDLRRFTNIDRCGIRRFSPSCA